MVGGVFCKSAPNRWFDVRDCKKMAPSPEHDNEPKAPDKGDNKKTTKTDLIDDTSLQELQVSFIIKN